MLLPIYKDLLGALLGGGAGASSRFLLSYYVQSMLPKNFPWGVSVVNVVGCFLAGLLFVLLENRFSVSSFYRSILFIGFLGGFTTFSSFSIDTVLLWESHAYLLTVVNIVTSVFLSLGATLSGLWLARRLLL